MNSFNLLAARVTPSSSPGPSRTNSLGSLGLAVAPEESRSDRDVTSSDWSPASLGADEPQHPRAETGGGQPRASHDDHGKCNATECGASMGEIKEIGERTRTWHLLPKRVATTIINSLRWVLSTLVSPGVYFIACFYDENGNFAPLLQLKKLFGFKTSPKNIAADLDANPDLDEKTSLLASVNRTYGGVNAMSSPMASSAISESESDADSNSQRTNRGSDGRRRQSKASLDSEEISPARRSIRIKLHNDEALRQRRQKKSQAASAQAKPSGDAETPDIAVQLKSPTSPVGALTKYPRTPAPPRPLIPRRQPSYLNLEPLMPTHQKTLILDLDETLIHSMSKGGRMSTGHMVEVRLTTTVATTQDGPRLGPQHPILYYVHKRPHCDDFLRRVCKWYNLVIFTASVQEYADPVIDWLEQERKYFSARYYRQHCTFRQGAFIKDLSSVEPDLSKVMILDNSPLSYLFNQDNAIPIHGWTNDPTDKHLMHLVPMLEGLQYVTDVRAFLALRGGEDGQHMA